MTGMPDVPQGHRTILAGVSLQKATKEEGGMYIQKVRLHNSGGKDAYKLPFLQGYHQKKFCSEQGVGRAQQNVKANF